MSAYFTKIEKIGVSFSYFEEERTSTYRIPSNGSWRITTARSELTTPAISNTHYLHSDCLISDACSVHNMSTSHEDNYQLYEYNDYDKYPDLLEWSPNSNALMDTPTTSASLFMYRKAPNTVSPNYYGFDIQSAQDEYHCVRYVC